MEKDEAQDTLTWEEQSGRNDTKGQEEEEKLEWVRETKYEMGEWE